MNDYSTEFPVHLSRYCLPSPAAYYHDQTTLRKEPMFWTSYRWIINIFTLDFMVQVKYLWYCYIYYHSRLLVLWNNLFYRFTGSCSFYCCAVNRQTKPYIIIIIYYRPAISLSIVYLVLLYNIMTRVDTAERTSILHSILI